jgi:hypothetical protein
MPANVNTLKYIDTRGEALLNVDNIKSTLAVTALIGVIVCYGLAVNRIDKKTVANTSNDKVDVKEITVEAQEAVTDIGVVESGSTLARDSLAVRMVESVKNLVESEKIVIENPVIENADTKIATETGENTTKEIVTPTDPGDKAPFEERENYVWNRIIQAGYSEVVAAAIIGNFVQESRINPADRPIIYRDGVAFGGLGIAQWNGGRREKLIAMYPDSFWTLESQVDFLIYELNHSYAGVHNNLLGYKDRDDLEESVHEFTWGFEKPKREHANIAARIANAQLALDRQREAAKPVQISLK